MLNKAIMSLIADRLREMKCVVVDEIELVGENPFIGIAFDVTFDDCDFRDIQITTTVRMDITIADNILTMSAYSSGKYFGYANLLNISAPDVTPKRILDTVEKHITSSMKKYATSRYYYR